MILDSLVLLVLLVILVKLEILEHLGPLVHQAGLDLLDQQVLQPVLELPAPKVQRVSKETLDLLDNLELVVTLGP